MRIFRGKIDNINMRMKEIKESELTLKEVHLYYYFTGSVDIYLIY